MFNPKESLHSLPIRTRFWVSTAAHKHKLYIIFETPAPGEREAF
jgi:hypothetical protein